MTQERRSNENGARKKLYEHEKFSKLITPLAYDPESQTFIMSDGYIGFALISNPLIFADESTAEKLNAFLSQNYPEDSFVQVHLYAGQDIAPQLEKMEGIRRKEIYKNLSRDDSPLSKDKPNPLLYEDSVLFQTIKGRSKFYKSCLDYPIEDRNNTRVREIYVIVTCKIPFHGVIPKDNEITLISDLQRATKQALDTSGMKCLSLNAELYQRVMNSIFNWQQDAQWKQDPHPYDENQTLNNQLLDYKNSLEVDQNGLRIGNSEDGFRYVRTLSVKRYPKSTFISAANYFLGDLRTGSRGIRTNFMLTMNVHYPESEKLRANLESKRLAVNYQIGRPMLRYIPKLVRQKESFDVLFSALEDGDKPVKAYMTLTLFGKDEDDVISSASSTKTYYRELGYQLMEDTNFCLPIFLNSIPFGCDIHAVEDLERYKSFGTRHVTHMLPICGDWKGTQTPSLNFVSRNGQLMSYCLFDSETNYNAIICASSGSGKSFLSNFIITSYLSYGANVWVIDVGFSYEKICQALEGDFIEFSTDSSICLNPFDIVEDIGEEIDMLAGILSAMAFPTESMSDFQLTQLKRIILAVWEKNQKATKIDHVAEALLKERDDRVRDIGYQLHSFTTEGEYGRYFCGKNNMDFNNPLTVLELEHLKQRKHLQRVVLLQLIYQINQATLLGELERKKIVIIDEAWDLLSEGDAAAFIEKAYRRFRKTNSACIVITQSVNDLYNSTGGIAIAENSANMFLLGQRAETVNSLKAQGRLDLSDGGFDLIKTVKTIKGRYSEIFIYSQDHGAGIARLIVDRFDQLLYSTKAEERQAIKSYMDAGLTITQAINEVMADEQRRAA